VALFQTLPAQLAGLIELLGKVKDVLAKGTEHARQKKKLRKLTEEWKDSMKVAYRDDTFDIFRNPTKAEIGKLPNNKIRFLVDVNKKEIHVFDADLLHALVMYKLKLDPTNLRGQGRREDGKIKPNNPVMWRGRFIERNNWLRKWLDIK
jgi:hypothetical protein